MKIKIIEPGWAGFTGNMGGVEFEDGISVRAVVDWEAKRIANAVRCELEDGTNPSSSQQNLDSRAIKMDAGMTTAAQVAATAKPPVKVYTRAELEAVADAGGIAALRKLADPLDLRANAISKLIDMLAMHYQPVQSEAALMGSGKFDKSYEIDGKNVPLGDIVRAAFQDSGLSVEEWNDPSSEVTRDQMIGNELACRKYAVEAVVKSDGVESTNS